MDNGEILTGPRLVYKSILSYYFILSIPINVLHQYSSDMEAVKVESYVPFGNNAIKTIQRYYLMKTSSLLLSICFSSQWLCYKLYYQYGIEDLVLLISFDLICLVADYAPGLCIIPLTSRLMAYCIIANQVSFFK